MKKQEIIEKIENAISNVVECRFEEEEFINGVVIAVNAENLPTYYISIGSQEITHAEENDFVFLTTENENVEYKLTEYVLPRIKSDLEYYNA